MILRFLDLQISKRAHLTDSLKSQHNQDKKRSAAAAGKATEKKKSVSFHKNSVFGRIIAPIFL